MKIEKAKPSDSKIIANIIYKAMSKSIGSDIIGRTIYSVPGYALYIEDNIKTELIGNDVRYYVCRYDNTVVGCIEIRILKDTLVTNATAKNPEYKDIKIGGGLKYEAAKIAVEREYEFVETDVFTNNDNSLVFQKSMGYEELKRYDWFVIDRLKAPTEKLYHLVEFPQAEIIHKRYGFSHFDVATSKGVYTVGRIGNSIYRLRGFDWMEDNAFLTALRSIDPKRKLLIIAESGRKPSLLCDPIASLVRFRCKTSLFKANLERKEHFKS